MNEHSSRGRRTRGVSEKLSVGRGLGPRWHLPCIAEGPAEILQLPYRLTMSTRVVTDNPKRTTWRIAAWRIAPRGNVPRRRGGVRVPARVALWTIGWRGLCTWRLSPTDELGGGSMPLPS